MRRGKKKSCFEIQEFNETKATGNRESRARERKGKRKGNERRKKRDGGEREGSLSVTNLISNPRNIKMLREGKKKEKKEKIDIKIEDAVPVE